MSDRYGRVAGALLGVHAGDSLGATLEFMSWQEVRERYPDGLREIVGGGVFDWPAGAPTDDTDLTRAVVLAYLDRARDPSAVVVRSAAEHMLDWFEGRWPGRVEGTAPRDVGGATERGLSRYRESGDPLRAGAGRGQAGNGSLMRCIPTALFQPDAGLRAREAMLLSAITHDDARCTVACAAYVEVAAALVGGAGPAAALAAGEDVARTVGPAAQGTPPQDDAHAADEVLAAFAAGRAVELPLLAAHGPGRAFPRFGGYVLTALTLAVAAVLDPRPAADVLVDVVRLGGDADTNGAIAGGLLGARDGLGALPEAWLGRLQLRDEFLAAARTLHESPAGR
ncbi:MAG: ADP-ribosylglycohydrolase family protein [Actinobacteria bacterium]|nr:ADP-ribosylglycohydrolase family protein [Actinomycetota bacterium]